MKILENYNTASQKYGNDSVLAMQKEGIPGKYLLSACRFNADNGISPSVLKQKFRQWMTYVVKHDENIDVNKLNYNEFLSIISYCFKEYCVPNKIFGNGDVYVGDIKSHKDVRQIPVENRWCIKSEEWYSAYVSKGWKFLVVYMPKQPMPITYVIVGIHDGNVEYYNAYDYQKEENLVSNVGNDEHNQYQSLLPDQVQSIIYEIAAAQTDEIESKKANESVLPVNLKSEKETIYTENKTRQKMKQRFRINESQLRRIVSESVKRCLNEDENQDFQLIQQESLYKTLCSLNADIKTVISNTDTSSSQAFGSPEEKLAAISNALTHIDSDIAKQSESTFSKLIEVLSELQSLCTSLKTFGAEDPYWGHPFKTPFGTVSLSRYSY